MSGGGGGKASDFGNTLFMFLLVMGVAWWVGSIYMAKGEERLTQACKPIEFTTDAVHQLATVALGEAPVWTLQLQAYLMSGCYYLSKTIIESTGVETEKEAPSGGIRSY